MSHAAAELSVLRGNVARDRQMKHMSELDVITGLPLVQQQPPPPPREASRTFASGSQFHILSGEGLPPELQSDAAKTARPARPLLNYAPTMVRRRAIDILSNAYVQDDEAKQERDAAFARERALRRYAATRLFNPLTQTYYDAEKEEAAARVVELSRTVQGAAQRTRLPPSIAVSTGQAYDIVRHVPRDAETLNTIDLMETRGLRARTRAATEVRQRDAGDARAATEDARAVHRMAYRKYEELSDPHGFNILNGQGVPSTALAHSRAGATLRPWDRITRDLSTAPAAVAGMTVGHDHF